MGRWSRVEVRLHTIFTLEHVSLSLSPPAPAKIVCFIQYLTPRSGLKKPGTAVFKDQLRDVWISYRMNESLSRVFNIGSQNKVNCFFVFCFKSD